MIQVEKVLICGGREFSDQKLFAFTMKMLPALVAEHFHRQRMLATEYCIIQGGAKGADKMAKNHAILNGLPCMDFDANWYYYQNSAGPIRNRWMNKFAQPHIGVAFPGGSGTRDMIKALQAARVPVFDVSQDRWV